jgi:hypothetical protein
MYTPLLSSDPIKKEPYAPLLQHPLVLSLLFSQLIRFLRSLEALITEKGVQYAKEAPMPAALTFAEIEPEFLQRVQTMVWCTCATVDTRNRPRSRILQPLWEGATGWVLTRRHSLKVTHLAANAFVSLAYGAEPFKPVYVECRAVWEEEPATKQRLGELFRHTPPPLGYDPARFGWYADKPESGLLRLLAWRIELVDLFHPPHAKVWRAAS